MLTGTAVLKNHWKLRRSPPVTEGEKGNWVAWVCDTQIPESGAPMFSAASLDDLMVKMEQYEAKQA